MTEPHAGTLRIIGGRWRTRRITFIESEGLRPTPNRVRETLFNWLAPEIQGSRCLDLFAGSGALSIEALSRGAASVTIVDRSKSVIDRIERQLEALDASGSHGAVQFVVSDALRWIDSEPAAASPFDIAFIDPPFREDLAARCCARLASSALLRAGALAYIESAERIVPADLPGTWEIVRQKRANQVHYCLCRTN